jgi:hypothetical protein
MMDTHGCFINNWLESIVSIRKVGKSEHNSKIRRIKKTTTIKYIHKKSKLAIANKNPMVIV